MNTNYAKRGISYRVSYNTQSFMGKMKLKKSNSIFLIEHHIAAKLLCLKLEQPNALLGKS